MGYKLCRKCGENARWGRSGICWYCLCELELVVTADGEPHDPAAGPAPSQLYAARYRYRAITCGKNCSGCPHGFYVYRVWRVDGVAREKYLGRIGEELGPYESPILELQPPASERQAS